MAQTTINGKVVKYSHQIKHDGKRHLLEQGIYMDYPAKIPSGSTIFCLPLEGDVAPVKRTFVSWICACQEGMEERNLDHHWQDLYCGDLITTVEDGPDQRYVLVWQVVGTVEL